MGAVLCSGSRHVFPVDNSYYDSYESPKQRSPTRAVKTGSQLKSFVQARAAFTTPEKAAEPPKARPRSRARRASKPASLSSAVAALALRMAGPKRGALPPDLPRWAVLELGPDLCEFQLVAHGADHEEAGWLAVQRYLSPTRIFYIWFNPTALQQLSPKVVLLVWLGPDAEMVGKGLSQARRKELDKLSAPYFTIKATLELEHPSQCSLHHMKLALQGMAGGRVTDAPSPAVSAAVASNTPPKKRESPVKPPPTPLTPQELAAAQQLQAKLTAEGKERFSLAEGGFFEVTFKQPATGHLARQELVAALRQHIARSQSGSEWVVIGIKLPANAWLEAAGKEGALSSAWMQQWLTPDAVQLVVCNLQSTAGGYGMKTYAVVIRWLGGAVPGRQAALANNLFPALVTFTRGTLGTFAADVRAHHHDEVAPAALLERIQGTKLRGEEQSLPERDALFAQFGRTPEDLVFSNRKDMLAAVREMVVTEAKELLVWLEMVVTEAKELLVWLVVTYEPQQICRMHMILTQRLSSEQAVPDALFTAFKSLFRADNICFVLHRSFFIPSQFASVPSDRRRRYIKARCGLILWQGVDISLMAKALSSYHWKEWTELVKQ
eukprot:g37186.t1